MHTSMYSRFAQAGHKAAHRHQVGRHFGQAADVADNVQNVQSTFQNRAFENDEDLFGRDLDAEELFGRKYGHRAPKEYGRRAPKALARSSAQSVFSSMDSAYRLYAPI